MWYWRWDGRGWYWSHHHWVVVVVVVWVLGWSLDHVGAAAGVVVVSHMMAFMDVALARNVMIEAEGGRVTYLA